MNPWMAELIAWLVARENCVQQSTDSLHNDPMRNPSANAHISRNLDDSKPHQLLQQLM